MKQIRFVVTFFLSLTLTFQLARAENVGAELRLLIRELIIASSTPNKEEARHKLDDSILNHPLAIQAWLDGKSTKELLKEANLPPAEKFSSILETIQTGIYPLGSQLNQLHNSLSIEQRKKILSLVPASVKDQTLERINSEISDLKLEKFEAVQAINAPNGFSSLGDVPPAAIKLFTDLINIYFEKLSPQSKRQIIIDFLALPPSASQGAEIGIILQNSGPLMQKLFQLVGKRSDNPLVREASEQLFSSIRPFPFSEVTRVIEERTGSSIDSLFDHLEAEPLAAGTVGQVHRGILKGSKQKVAVKILRPNIEQDIQREFEVLESSIASEHLSTLNDLKTGIFRELDLIREANSIAKGKSAYECPSQGLCVAGLAEGTQPYKDLLILEFAEGKPMNKQPPMTKHKKYQQANRFAKFTTRWAYQVFFNGGFAHVDLHSGNIFYDLSEKNPNGKQTLLDFGSTIEIKPTTARSFIRLFLAAQIKDIDLTFKALRDDVSVTPEQENALRKHITDTLFDESLSSAKKMGIILYEAQQQGLPISGNLIHLLRGQLFVEEHITNLNHELDLLDPDHTLGRFSKQKIFAKSGLWGLIKDFNRFVLGKSDRTLTADLVARLAWEINKQAYHYAKNTVKTAWQNSCAGLLARIHP